MLAAPPHASTSSSSTSSSSDDEDAEGQLQHNDTTTTTVLTSTTAGIRPRPRRNTWSSPTPPTSPPTLYVSSMGEHEDIIEEGAANDTANDEDDAKVDNTTMSIDLSSSSSTTTQQQQQQQQRRCRGWYEGGKGRYYDDTPKLEEKKLFLGGLPPNCDKEQVEEYFSKFGLIEDAIVMVDKFTGRSRGFGFITFDKAEDMKKCLDNTEPHLIMDKIIDVKRAVEGGLGPHGVGGGGALYGGPTTATSAASRSQQQHEGIRSSSSGWGHHHPTSYYYNNKPPLPHPSGGGGWWATGNSGSGYITAAGGYNKGNDNNTTVPYRVPDDPSKVFIGGLPPTSDKDTLTDMLSQYGDVIECNVMFDRDTGRNRGFAYATFATPQEANAACKGDKDDDEEEEKKDKLLLLPDNPCKIFLGGLPQTADEDRVTEHLSQYGKVIDVTVMYDRDTGRHRGFAYATFSNGKEALASIKGGDNNIIDGKWVQIKASSRSMEHVGKAAAYTSSHAHNGPRRDVTGYDRYTNRVSSSRYGGGGHHHHEQGRYYHIGDIMLRLLAGDIDHQQGMNLRLLLVELKIDMIMKVKEEEEV
ncbi:hypothetical protein FOL47_010477 [Perkinsus chesapeaki]|uniref:RRM domain-containing protein n=1 Tax=Perkinsus chesapeaki TaxID=330153 RepID=A0A7J6L1Q1_PERCH|nr:hypothetical protein FOL47_010477 [Perkinsus chesapeaki]